MMIRIVVMAIGLAAVCGGGVQAGWAYEQEPVENGAVISGRVIFKGAVPAPRPFGLIVYPDIELCEKISDGQGRRLLRDFAVSTDGGFQDVAVVVEGVEEGKPFPASGHQVAIQDCDFIPFMSVVRDRTPMRFQNNDGVIHDIQTYAIQGDKRGDRIFDRAALPNATLAQEIKLTGGQKVVWTQCGKHSFMQTWAYAVDNPYYAVTGSDGRFTISGLPPGRYRITAWHPFMNLREQTVDVAPHSKVVVNFEFGKQETK